MTLREIAKMANVSLSTASKAFNDAPDVSEETRQEIFRVAKQYGCFGKYYKGKYNKKILAMICPELRSEYYATFVERMKEKIEQEGGIFLLSADGFTPEKQREMVEYYASYLKVDGVFVISMKEAPKEGYDVPVAHPIFQFAFAHFLIIDYIILFLHYYTLSFFSISFIFSDFHTFRYIIYIFPAYIYQ